MGIIAAGFSKHCSISIYHLWIVGELAWLAANTHLASVTALREQFREHSTTMNCRVILMFVMFVFLTMTLVWATFLGTAVGGCRNDGCLAQCAWHFHHSMFSNLSSGVFRSLNGIDRFWSICSILQGPFLLTCYVICMFPLSKWMPEIP